MRGASRSIGDMKIVLTALVITALAGVAHAGDAAATASDDGDASLKLVHEVVLPRRTYSGRTLERKGAVT